MRNYETVIIFYPDVEEETRNSVMERLTNIIKENGSVDEIDEWGDRKFAYEIEYNNHGYYYLVKFKTEPETIVEFERIAKIQESILRYMVINLDK